MRQVNVSLGFESKDLIGKSWENIINELFEDFKNAKLSELKSYKVPVKLIGNVILTFNKNGQTDSNSTRQ